MQDCEGVKLGWMTCDDRDLSPAFVKMDRTGQHKECSLLATPGLWLIIMYQHWLINCNKLPH